MKDNKIGETCSTHAEAENTYIISVEKSQGKDFSEN